MRNDGVGLMRGLSWKTTQPDHSPAMVPPASKRVQGPWYLSSVPGVGPEEVLNLSLRVLKVFPILQAPGKMLGLPAQK